MINRTLFWASLILGIKRPVDGYAYRAVGFGLMALKYVVEVSAIFVATGIFFDPISFLIPSLTLRSSFINASPPWLPWATVIWSLPFLWIAVTMSVRRAVDAGRNPIMGVLVLMPVLNLFIMLWLASLPTTPTKSSSPTERLQQQQTTEINKLFVYAPLLGIVIGGVFAFTVTVISANLMHNYGGSLFLGMPIVSGAVAGFVYNQPYTKGIKGSLGVGAMSVVLGGMALLLFALEGVICLVMAVPLIIPFGALGGLLGWFLSTVIIWQSKWMLGGALLALVPVIGTFEVVLKQPETLMVESSVVINASIDRVWENVIQFPEIDSPTSWLFQLGVASPLRARIEGDGVGAVRYCEFTTGDFVEPITIWDKPNRLAFDVTDQPDPMIELTPYRGFRPPHLTHSFYSVRGEFELVPQSSDKTLLVGRTWYVVDMGPRCYWKLWTDTILHQIHLRVLNHIAEQAESE